MYPILKAEKLADKIYLMEVKAPRVAKSCQPGEFVIVKIDEAGERIPLTICDYNREKGTVTIGIPMNLGACILPVVVPVFRRRYPGVKVFIRENNSQELEKMMLSHKVDFCIMHFQKALDEVCYDEFSEDPFYLAVPEIFQSQVSLSEEKSLKAEDIRQLKKIPFVMVASRQKLRQVADEILRKAGIRPDICCTTKSMETAKRLAAGGMGATFLPKSYMTLYSGTEGLSCYPLDKELGASWKLVAAYPADEKLSRASREFLRTLKECLE